MYKVQVLQGNTVHIPFRSYPTENHWKAPEINSMKSDHKCLSLLRMSLTLLQIQQRSHITILT